MARLASTSLAFMLWLVPAPAWNGSMRKLSMSSACLAARAASKPAFIGSEPRASASSSMAAAAHEDLVGGLDDRVPQILGQPARGHVRASGRLLDLDDGPDQGGMRTCARDREVVDAARGLDAVVGAVGNLEVAQRVLLDSEPRTGSWGSDAGS